MVAALVGCMAGMVGSTGALGASAENVTIEISVIHATRTDGGLSIDPQLRDVPQLTKQQPFVRYNVFRLLDRQRLAIGSGKRVTCELVDGRTLQVTFLGVSDDDAGPKGGERYQVRAEIGGPGKKEFLRLLEVSAGANEPFFVGGQGYKGGTLFLELAIR